MKSNIFKYSFILILLYSCESVSNDYYSFPETSIPKTYQNGLHSFSLVLAMRYPKNKSIELKKLDGITDILFNNRK
ncbi:hypothetical protein OAJ56_00155 [Flavobacteriales bacterium]|nr:hypothetical protein [Flavobacteriales bacterium]